MKENVTQLGSPNALQLDTVDDPNASNYMVWQNESYSDIRYYIENEEDVPQTLQSSGVYTNTWYEGDWWSGSYLKDWYLAPKQYFVAHWEGNFTVPQNWILTNSVFLRLRFLLQHANFSTSFTHYNYSTYVKPGNVTVWNWQTSEWDGLAVNLSGHFDGAWQPYLQSNGIYPLSHQHINPNTQNITVRVYGGEGENSSWVRTGVRINYAGIFLNISETSRCQNYTGYYQSEVIELPESVWRWENFTLDVAGVSYTEGMDQQQPNHNYLQSFGMNLPNPVITGQSITPAETDYMRIEVVLQKTNNPTDAVKMELYEAQADLPIGMPLASDTIPAANLTTTPFAYNFTIRYHLNMSRSYCFVLSRTGALSNINYYQVAFQSIGTYSGGMHLVSLDGAVWILEPLQDMCFRTFYFIDSYLDCEVRSSPDGVSWGGWSTTRHRHTDFSRHTYILAIQQNTTFLQCRLPSNFHSIGMRFEILKGLTRITGTYFKIVDEISCLKWQLDSPVRFEIPIKLKTVSEEVAPNELSVLEAFNQPTRKQTLEHSGRFMNIPTKTGIPKSELPDLLDTLVEKGLLKRVAVLKTFGLYHGDSIERFYITKLGRELLQKQVIIDIPEGSPKYVYIQELIKHGVSKKGIHEILKANGLHTTMSYIENVYSDFLEDNPTLKYYYPSDSPLRKRQRHLDKPILKVGDLELPLSLLQKMQYAIDNVKYGEYDSADASELSETVCDEIASSGLDKSELKTEYGITHWKLKRFPRESGFLISNDEEGTMYSTELRVGEIGGLTLDEFLGPGSGSFHLHYDAPLIPTRSDLVFTQNTDAHWLALGGHMGELPTISIIVLKPAHHWDELYKSNLWIIVDILYQWFQPRFLYIDPEESEEEYRIAFHLIVHPKKQLEVLKGWKTLFHAYVDVFTFHVKDEVVIEVSSEKIPKNMVQVMVELMGFNLKNLSEEEKNKVKQKVHALLTLSDEEERDKAISTYFKESFMQLFPPSKKLEMPEIIYEMASLYPGGGDFYARALRFFSSGTTPQLPRHTKQWLETFSQNKIHYPRNYNPKQRLEKAVKRFFHRYKIVDKEEQERIRKKVIGDYK